MRLLSKAAVALVVAGAALTGVPAAQASAAAMPGCTVQPPGRNLDAGYGVMKGSYNLKGTPYQNSCSIARMRKGQVLYFHCWRTNSHGNRWVYGRIKGTKKYGWMSLDNFKSIRNTNFATCSWDGRSG
jgi:hypothetical protein